MRSVVACILFFLFMAVRPVFAGELVLYVFGESGPLNGAGVQLDGSSVGTTNANGMASTVLKQGKHEVVLTYKDERLATFGFENAEDESVDASVTAFKGVEPVVSLDTYKQAVDSKPEDVAKGLYKGTVVSKTTGDTVVGAIISIESLSISALTDDQGGYQIELPRGNYEVEVSHPRYASRKLENVQIVASVVNESTIRLANKFEFQLPPMEEVNVVATYVPNAIAGIQFERTAAAVVDTLDTEQLKRFGGSTAASALTRVAGVTTNRGKYAVVRGLDERYSTVTLNGSSLPSPDPSRRVVPLDIFPSTLLQGIEVQKASTSDQPLDSTGGVIKLKTTRFPTEFEGDLTVSLGYVDGLSGKTRTMQKSKSGDRWADGADDRAIPGPALALQTMNPIFVTAEDQKAAAEALDPQQLANDRQKVDPNLSVELGIGDTLAQFDSGVDLGYQFSFRYENAWAREDSQRRDYVSGGTENSLILREDVNYSRTENNIDLGIGGNLGLVWDQHKIDINLFRLSQAEAETVVKTGLQGDNRNLQVKTEHRWNQREFEMQQIVGEHTFEKLWNTDFKWNISTSTATFDSPDQREYEFRTTSPDDDPSVTLDDIQYEATRRNFVSLEDENSGYGLDFVTEVFANDNWMIKLNYGIDSFDRDRDAQTWRFTYTEPMGLAGFEDETEIGGIINAETIADGRFSVAANTNPTDKYDASWEMLANYFSTILEIDSKWRIQFGQRVEESDLTVNTFVDAPGDAIPLLSRINTEDTFDSFNITYSVTEDLQIRAGFNGTVNRPDFRELSNAQYIDPESGDSYRGNPKLLIATVDNYDLRAEWYFSENESLTFAYFFKEFTDPIEKTVTPIGGAGQLFSFVNSPDGEISGYELDLRKEFQWGGVFAFVSGNIALIDSSVEIVDESIGKTTARNMQGQPDQLLNIQFGLDDEAGGREYTAIFQRKGESIYSIAVGLLPPIINETRDELELKFAQYFDVERNYKLKVSLKNLLGDPVKLTQGGELYRTYEEDKELEIGMGIKF